MVYLGLYEFEQENRQKVKLDIKIRYSDPVDDAWQLDDYDQITSSLQEALLPHRFGLIEELGEYIWQWLADRTNVCLVSVSKLTPPSKVNIDSVTFTLEE